MAALDENGNPVTDVFEFCSAYLKASHEAAVRKRLRVNQGLGNRPIGPSLAQDLKEISDEYTRFGRCLVEACASIARYSILAWTYYIGLVVWDEPTNGNHPEQDLAQSLLGCPEGIQHQHHLEQRIYHPNDIEALPRSFILC